MLGRTLFAAIVALGAANSVLAADESPSRRLPTLGERLEMLRQDLAGDAKPANAPASPKQQSTADPQFSAGRKLLSQPRKQPATAKKQDMDDAPVLSAPTTQTPAKQSPAKPTPTPATTTQAPPSSRNQAIVRPPLEPQSARKAKPTPAKAPSRIDIDDEPLEPTEESLAPLVQSPAKQSPTMAKPLESRVEDSSDEPRIAKSAPTMAPKEGDNAGPQTASPNAPLAPARAPDWERADSMGSEQTRPLVQRPTIPTPAGGVLFTTQGPIISVEASGPRKVMIGKEAEFLVRVTNGGSAANNVVVSMNIPPDTEVIAANASAGSALPGSNSERREPMEWKIPRLEGKSTETLNLKLVPRKSTPLDLALQWTFTPEASQAMVEVQEPKLVMSISGPEEVMYGQSKVYRLTLSNPGNGDSENVVVALLPVGRASEGIASHRLGTLKAGETKTIDIELTARQSGALTIKAQAYADAGLRTEAAQQVLVRRANLQLDVESPKVKYAGTSGTYKVKITNNGNSPADNVQVSAMLPPDAKFLSAGAGGRHEAQAGRVNWAIGSLAPGASRTVDMQCSLSAPGENRMQFMSVAGDLTAQATSSTQVEALADLKLEVRDPQGPIAVGEATVYEVHIRNRGTKAAEDIDVAVFFSDGLEATSVDGGAHDIAPGQVAFRPIASLGAGESAVFRVHARADKPGNHVFRAEVNCQTLSMKLAAEEATRFYGDENVRPSSQPTPLSARREDPAPSPFNARREDQPTEAAPRRLAPWDEPGQEE